MTTRAPALLAVLLLAASCGPTQTTPQPGLDPSEAPLSDLSVIFDGAPDNESLPDENKADAIYPAKLDLVAYQSPVKSQGHRGTCTIFATTALMEHLYLVAGWPEADFSEQYLQWSVKNEIRAFPHTAGSNASSNLRAINRYGIVEEASWPYESSQWDASDDPECEGSKDLPTKCYTNGAPPETASAAEKFRLPPGRWLRTNSIKAHMTARPEGRRTAVVVGVEFFYQAWNHGASKLTTNRDYWRKGYVTYPNAEDKADSRERPAGHGILLVGWDDELEVPMRDGSGELVLDADGNPKTEKGFYVFKNSWGTGSFGSENPLGDGYGYISERYIEEFGTAYVSDVPDVQPKVEICGDGADNDGNGLTDCDDAACSASPECGTSGTTTLELSSTPGTEIPDNDPAGIEDTLDVTDAGTVGSVTVTTYITHSYQGDLVVTLTHGGKTVTLHDRTGGGTDDLYEAFSVTDFEGADAAGAWTLSVSDNAHLDTGTLDGWDLAVSLQ